MNDSPSPWVVAGAAPARGGWIKISFDAPRSFDYLTITPLADGPARPVVTRVTLSTAAGSVSARLAPTETPQKLRLPVGPTSWVKVTMAGVAPAKLHGSILSPGIRHIALPGVTVTRSLRVPADEAGVFSRPSAPSPTYVFSSPAPNPYNILGQPDEEVAMSRLFDVPRPAGFAVTGAATPRSSPQLDALLARHFGYQVQASSTYLELPQFRVDNLVDSNPTTIWMAGASDRRPIVRISWTGKRILSSVDVVPSDIASEPTELSLSSPDGNRTVEVPPGGGLVQFPALLTDQVVVGFPKVAAKTSASMLPPFLPVRMPVGLGELTFPALADLASALPVPGLGDPILVACGMGPSVVIDGKVFPTEAMGTRADLE
ncbi:MAG: hypothetical protein ACRD1G_00615, partial [Acidimicrobiales bacterium]